MSAGIQSPGVLESLCAGRIRCLCKLAPAEKLEDVLHNTVDIADVAVVAHVR